MSKRARALMTRCLATLAAVALGCGASATNRTTIKLYVTNSRGDDITVIDLSSLKVVDDIKVGPGVHGVCAPADGRRVIATVTGEKNVKVIDTATDKILDTIALTGPPNLCGVTPDGRLAVVAVYNPPEVDIVDLQQRKIVKTLPLGMAHNCYDFGSNAEAYCEDLRANQIDAIDLKKLVYAQKIPVGGQPRPFQVSRDNQKMYVAETGLSGFTLVNLVDGAIQRVPLPPIPPNSVCNQLEPNTPTHGVELSPDGKTLWVTSVIGDGVYVYDIAQKKLSAMIPTGRCPNWISLSPDGKYASVSNSADDTVSVINAQTHSEVARIKVGKAPKRLLAVAVPAN